MTGYSPSEIVGVHFSNFIHKDDFERIVDRYGEALSGQERPSEYRILTKSGEARWVSTFSRPIREERHESLGFKGYFRMSRLIKKQRRSFRIEKKS